LTERNTRFSAYTDRYFPSRVFVVLATPKHPDTAYFVQSELLLQASWRVHDTTSKITDSDGDISATTRPTGINKVPLYNVIILD
jgi:hypothetical protein